MIDSHVHVGWFVDRYHAPDEITIALREVGIDTIAVSPRLHVLKNTIT